MSNKLKLQIITPRRVVLEKEVDSITAPTSSGEITILPKHCALFSVLNDGVVKIKHETDETFFSIGGGYIETDGIKTHLLVSRAAAQDELDEKSIEEARINAEKNVKEAKTKEERAAALTSLRRSMVDMKLIKRVKKKTQ